MISNGNLNFQLNNLIKCKRPSKLSIHNLLIQISIWQEFYRTANSFCNKVYKQEVELVKEEDNMEDSKLMEYLVQDILASGEYTIEGIARYARIPFDVIMDLAAGINTNPSFVTSTKIIYLHTTVRRSLYESIKMKFE